MPNNKSKTTSRWTHNIILYSIAYPAVIILASARCLYNIAAHNMYVFTYNRICMVIDRKWHYWSVYYVVTATLRWRRFQHGTYATRLASASGCWRPRSAKHASYITWVYQNLARERGKNTRIRAYGQDIACGV